MKVLSKEEEEEEIWLQSQGMSQLLKVFFDPWEHFTKSNTHSQSEVNGTTYTHRG